MHPRTRLSAPITPGLAVCAAAVPAAFGLHTLLPAVPLLTFAVVLGILFANLPYSAEWTGGGAAAGFGFASRHLMRAGIVLLGLKLSLFDVAALGWRSVLLVVAVVAVAFAGTYWLARFCRLPGDQPVLLATGFSICGASAIGAMAAVRGSRREDTVLPVALVTLCGSLAIAVLPALAAPLELPARIFGYWVGASVHDVGQVVAAAQTAGTTALAAAVLIKLTRVVLLAPMVAGAGLLQRYRASRRAGTDVPFHPVLPQPALPKSTPLVPLFVAGFLAMAALRTTGVLPQPVLDAGALLQEVALAAALFGLGAGIRLRDLAGTGGRAVVAALMSWVLIAAAGLFAAWLLAA